MALQVAAIVVQDGATTPHGEDVSGRTAPDTIEVAGGAAGHGAPGAAVVVQDGAASLPPRRHRGRTAPDTIKSVSGAAAHRAPGVPS